MDEKRRFPCEIGVIFMQKPTNHAHKMLHFSHIRPMVHTITEIPSGFVMGFSYFCMPSESTSSHEHVCEISTEMVVWS